MAIETRTRLLHGAVSILTLSAAALLLWHECWLPYRCNWVLRSVQDRTERAYDGGTPGDVAVMIGRENLRMIQECSKAGFQKVAVQMIIAANYRLLHRWDEALTAYRTALQYDRRPEIFLNIGFVLLEQGKREEAIRNFETASTFNPQIDANIRQVDPKIADIVARKVSSQF